MCIKWKYVFTLAAAVIMAAPGFAAPIFVNNFSFETLPSGGLPLNCEIAGCTYSVQPTPVPGWTVTGGGGQFQMNSTPNAFFNTLDDGPTQAYSNSGVFSQVVGPTVLLNMVYVLRVDLGYRLDAGFAGDADLLINGNRYTAVGVTPTRGSFGTFTATYTGLAADVGSAITIELNSNRAQGNYDNVRLDGTAPNAIPEPATLLLLGPALLMFGRRKRKLAVRG